MIVPRPAVERGRTDWGWLDSRHTFSFGQYNDLHHMGFGPLRVINDDRVAAGGGFDTHPHGDMEIVTCVLEGALAHKDSLGTGSVIKPGDVQRMSAGTGIRHSEFNASKSEPVHFLQIWIVPERQGLEPSYEQTSFPEEDRRNALKLVASGKPVGGALKIHQDVDLYSCLLGKAKRAHHVPAAGRRQWLHLAAGALNVNGAALESGDGLAISGEAEIAVEAREDSEFLLFDMS